MFINNWLYSAVDIGPVGAHDVMQNRIIAIKINLINSISI